MCPQITNKSFFFFNLQRREASKNIFAVVFLREFEHVKTVHSSSVTVAWQ